VPFYGVPGTSRSQWAEKLTSLGNVIFQSTRGTKWPLLKEVGAWARTSGTMAWIPGIRSRAAFIRRFAKAGRTLLRAARGGMEAAGLIALAIESYCAGFCMDCRNRKELYQEVYGPE